jgi:signal transduction histidine kinase
VRTGIAASFRLEGAGEPDADAATCLLRVLQEALVNVTRHAQATEVGVTLVLGPGAVELEVSDDGRGFDPAAPAAGSGLRGVRERCALLGGEVRLESAPGDGTRLRVRLPRAPAPPGPR